MTEQFADAAGRYVLESRIATGGMGVVWLGTDTLLHREVAVKVLKAEFADDPGFRARFADEARHAAALAHPGIAALYDVGETPATAVYPPRPFLVMEFVDGQPLNNLLRPDSPMDPAAVQDLMVQAAAALGAAHSAGIVHRDVKPANLLVTPARVVKVTDFGIARAAESVALTRTGQVMGTPQYLSPEQATGDTATPASDVYSLACVAYECLTGRRPFDAETAVATALAHVRQPVPTMPDHVPADLAAVVTRALAKDPADRYPDGTAFAAALRNPGGAAATAATRVAPTPAAGGDDTDSTQVFAAPPVEHGTQVLPAVTGVHTPGADQAGTPGARPGPDPEEGGSNTALWWLVGLAAVVLLAFFVWWNLSGSGDESQDQPSEPTTSTEPSPTTSATPTTEATVPLVAGDYVGRDVDAVAAELRQLGFRVNPTPVDNPGGRTENQVVSVDPSGDVERGALVTVKYWGQEAQEPSETPTPSPTRTPTRTPTPTPTPPSPSPTPSATPTPSETPSPSPSEQQSSSPALRGVVR